ncbi:2282_t:CDS:2, partial [Ambispora gerdemannii]
MSKIANRIIPLPPNVKINLDKEKIFVEGPLGKKLANKDEVVEPGSTVEFTVELTKPLTIEEKENFIIREGGSTVGQGTVLKTV